MGTLDYYTTAEAAEVLGVTPARVRQLVLAGALAILPRRGRDLHLCRRSVEAARGRPGPGRPPQEPAPKKKRRRGRQAP